MQLRSTFYLAAAILLAGSVPAVATPSTNGEKATQAQSMPADTTLAAADEKKVCKKLRRTGSRFAERVCLTKEEWNKVDAEG